MELEGLMQIDRAVLLFFNGSDSLFLDRFVSILTSGFAWTPLFLALLYLVIKNNDTMPQIMLTIGCALLCILLADGLADGIIKPLVARPRPLNDANFKDSIDVVQGIWDKSYSFFSAHAANTFSLAVFFSFLIRHRLAVVALVAWSVLNCWTRLYLGMHYPSDIVAGLLWGAMVGTGMYYLYRYLYYRFSPRISYVSSQYTRTGYAYADVDVMCAVMVFILLYAAIKAVIVFV
jgi:undecaprenyl-diphosphatase